MPAAASLRAQHSRRRGHALTCVAFALRPAIIDCTLRPAIIDCTLDTQPLL